MSAPALPAGAFGRPPARGVAPPMPVIVGAPRSGTTLLRFMLDAHPELAIPPETGFLALGSTFDGPAATLKRRFFEAVTGFPQSMPAWRDFQIPAEEFRDALEQLCPFSVADGFRTFYRLYASRFGKRRWGDKTPVYVLRLKEIAALLPEAHFIHLIRDGRDVALSLRQVWFSPGDDMNTLAGSWSRHVEAGRRQGAECPHYREVRYERLVAEPAAVLREICAFVGLPYDPGMERYYLGTPGRLSEHEDRFGSDGALVVSHETRLRQQRLTTRPPDPSRVHAWKGAMAPREVREFEAAAGELLRDLGYETAGR